MLEDDIKKLGSVIYTQSLKGHVGRGYMKNALIGSIDFEWDGDLLSIQISIEGANFIHYISSGQYNTSVAQIRALVLEDMEKAGISYKSHKNPKQLFLATYWSTAELGRMASFWEETEVSNSTANLLNISFSGYEDKKGQNRFTITILDVFHFFLYVKTKRKDLDSVAKFYGIEGKYDLEGVGGKSKQYWMEHMRELLTQYPKEFESYALADTITTEQLLRRHREVIWNITGVDLLRYPTGGSIAVEFFRTHYMKPDEVWGNRNMSVRKFVMKCAHGAIMQAYQQGEIGSVYENDFTGFYSFTSKNMKLLPRGEEDINRANTLEEFLSGYDGWCKVRFHYPVTYKDKKVYPGLPVQEYQPELKKKSPILFPESGISYCTGSEIRGAIAFGCKIELIEGHYYTEGTDKWSLMATEMIDERAKAKEDKNKLGEGVYKDIPNAGVGKLYQHKGRFNLELVKLVAEYLGISDSEAIQAIDGTGFHHIDFSTIEKLKEEAKNDERAMLENLTNAKEKTVVRLGNAFLPEWWSIILGRARAAMMWVVNTYGSENIAHISTDSYHDVKPLDLTMDTPFGEYKIEPTTDEPQKMKILRTKLYTHGEKVAGHAVHTTKDVQRELIEQGEETKYNTTKMKTLRDAIKEETEFGLRYEKEMRFNPKWDNKMKWDEKAKRYVNWENIAEYWKNSSATAST